MKEIVDELFENRDLKFKSFSSKLVNNVNEDSIIGVKIPIIRNIAKRINNSELSKQFINNLPHKYLEEYILHGILISLNKDINEVLNELNTFLPYVDNWIVCDTIKPKVFKKNLDIVYDYITHLLTSDNEYSVRFGIVTLIYYYLDDEKYISNNNELILNIKKDTYYINMAISWYFSFALIKQYDKTINIFEEKKIKNKWIHNKSIQKSVESFRICRDKKEYLKKLKVNKEDLC